MTIKKNFKLTLPDQPYKTETTLNNQIDCWYVGAKYLVVRVDTRTNLANNVVMETDDQNSIDLTRFIEENHRFFIFEASQNPLAAAYLSHNYETLEVPNYVETIETGEVYEYFYEDFVGVIEQIYFPNAIPVNSNNEFSEPQRRTHALSRQSVWDGIDGLKQLAEQFVADNDYTPAEQTRMNEYIDWLTNFKTAYANTDHWKIKFPTDLPRM